MRCSYPYATRERHGGLVRLPSRFLQIEFGRLVAGRTVTQVSGSGSAASTKRDRESKTCSLQAALAVRGQDGNAEAVGCCAKMRGERMPHSRLKLGVIVICKASGPGRIRARFARLMRLRTKQRDGSSH